MQLPPLSLPQGVLAALASSQTVSPGALWRVRRGSVACLVALLEVFPDRLVAAPVTFDLSEADDAALLLPPGSSSLEVASVLWVGLEFSLDPLLLERFWGSLRPGFAALPRGSRIWGPLDPRALSRAVLQDDLDELSA